MAAYEIESIARSWDDERDAAFFGITAFLFPCEFAYGAGVLLASYDDECNLVPAPATVAMAPAARATQPTGHVHTW